jgi:nucleotide-binding universal stress UspA family protein
MTLTEETMFHKILVALDQSELSDRVFEEAIAIAKATQGQLLLLHVLTPFDEGYPAVGFSGMDGLLLHQQAIETFTRQMEVLEKEGLEYLQSLTNRAVEAGVPAEFSQNVGSPGGTICALARTWNADLIVMGRRGRNGLSEILLGSVSNYVLHHAPCSVLAVQKQEPKTTEASVEQTSAFV